MNAAPTPEQVQALTAAVVGGQRLKPSGSPWLERARGRTSPGGVVTLSGPLAGHASVISCIAAFLD
jgi:hypothetical protein